MYQRMKIAETGAEPYLDCHKNWNSAYVETAEIPPTPAKTKTVKKTVVIISHYGWSLIYC